jgi:hypothetical protein
VSKVYVRSPQIVTPDQGVVDGHVRLLNALRSNDERIREKRAAWATVGNVVYFVRRNDLIKIGFTTNLRDRMYQLQVKPWQMLALVSGDEAMERRIHGRFIDALAQGDGLGKEHFHPVAELLDHIDAIRDRAGVPALIRWT